MVGRALMLAAVSAEALAGFAPWVRTGQRARDGFEVVDSARSLDILDSGVHRALAFGWYLVPLAAALCWLAVLLHLRVAATALAITAGLVGMAVTLIVENAAIHALPGLRTTLAAAVAAVVGAVVELMGSRERRTAHELAHEPQ